MSNWDEKRGLQGRLLKYFPERQLLIRARGNVTYVKLPPRIQILAIFTVCGFLAWSVYSSFKIVHRDAELESKKERIREVRDAYQGLNQDVATLRSQLLKRTSRLEERQRFLERVVGTDPVVVLEDITDTATGQTGTAPAETADDAADAPGDRDPQPGPDKSAASGRVGPHQAGDNGVGAVLASVADFFTLPGAQAAVDPLAAPESRRLERDVMARLDRIERAQIFQANQIVERTHAEIQRIKAVVDHTGTSADRMMALTERHRAQSDRPDPMRGMGGPMIAADGTISDPLDDGSGKPSPLQAAFEARRSLALLKSAVDGIPSLAPAADYYISSGFGSRVDPFTKRRSTHYGLDLAGWPGTDIYAAAAGKVVVARKKWPYGWMVEIDHGNGFRTRYGHMRKLHVQNGDTVSRKDLIGEMGTSGRSTSSHLHFEVWFDGEPRDPAPFIKAADDVFQIQRRENG